MTGGVKNILIFHPAGIGDAVLAGRMSDILLCSRQSI